MEKHPAKYWTKSGSGAVVQCELCPHECKIADSAFGVCRVRGNSGGELFTNTYSQVISLSMDPIEKKPLYHFYPGAQILSTGPRGCNLKCQFCQNWDISQEDGPTSLIEPEQLVEVAVKQESLGIAYTYTEPTIAFEFVMDTAKLARKAGLKNVLVTNGYVNPKPLAELLTVIDALNIDLKAMDDGFYRKYCGARLQPVLESIRNAAASDAIVEITNLLIPGYNDSDENIRLLVDFIASVDEFLPLHFSGYYPAYRFDAPPTPTEVLLHAHRIGEEKLAYVYTGNRRMDVGFNTHCPKCGNLLVARSGFSADAPGITGNGTCSRCARSVDIAGPWTKLS